MASTDSPQAAAASQGAAYLDPLRRGTVIPAHPLALDARRQLDERRQRALSRYYLAAGAGGLAVGVHTTQFQIHDPSSGLLQPVWSLAAEEMDRADAKRQVPLVRVAGICGTTEQAVREAALARDLGYQLGLVNLKALGGAAVDALVDHCRAVGEIVGVFGFYLQSAAGGIPLDYTFWRRLCELDCLQAIKIAPFNRYQTIDVVRAVVESGRDDVALYTGNDDNIVADLVTPYRFRAGGQWRERRIVGGLLGHWAVWTLRAVQCWQRCRQAVEQRGGGASAELLRLNVAVTDCNAALFDAANRFRGCLAGIHEILRRQGLLAGTWCLDENETLSPGQAEALDRVTTAYPELTDDAFVAEHRDRWLSG